VSEGTAREGTFFCATGFMGNASDRVHGVHFARVPRHSFLSGLPNTFQAKEPQRAVVVWAFSCLRSRGFVYPVPNRA